MGLTTGIFTKAAGIIVVAGGLVFAGSTWGGSDAVDGAISKIKEQANELNIFKSNETKLASKVTELKGQLASAQAEIKTLQDKYQAAVDSDSENTALVQQLEQQIAEKQAQIEELQADILALDGVAESEAQRLMDEINRLEGEIADANADAQRLANEVDGTTTPTAMSEAELNALIEGEVTPPTTSPEPPSGESEPEAPTPDKTIALISGTPQIIGGKLTIDKTPLTNSLGEVIGYDITLASTESSATWTVEIGGNTYTVGAGNAITIGSAESVDGKILTATKGSTTVTALLTNN